jgi:hypothetical protein
LNQQIYENDENQVVCRYFVDQTEPCGCREVPFASHRRTIEAYSATLAAILDPSFSILFRYGFAAGQVLSASAD